MDSLASKLRIGEKIALACGLVGVLFLGVIWQYHQSLQRVIRDYHYLHEVFEARKTHAFAIESLLSDTLQAESDFLFHRQESYVATLDERAQLLLARLRELAEIDEDSKRTATEIRRQMQDYLDRFHAIVEAWRVKGLDHNAGLQGAFRKTAHELEAQAVHFKTAPLAFDWLQILDQAREFDRQRTPGRRVQAQEALAQFRLHTRESALSPEVRQALLVAIDDYAAAFADGADAPSADAASAGVAARPAEAAARRLEILLATHFLADLESDLLQLRRREKDYLLRGDLRYVAMVEEIASAMDQRIQGSAIAPAEKTRLQVLVADYLRDFRALVAQTDRIDTLLAIMHQAAERIGPLVQRNLEEADSRMAEESARIAQTSRDSARLNLLIMFGAMALGTLLPFLIATRIIRPVREMAGLLDRLTHEMPPERIATFPGARDEINSMAESLNTMADHRANFMHWWTTSMSENTALRELHEADTAAARDQALEDLRMATRSKVEQMQAIGDQLLDQTDHIEDIAGRLRKSRYGALASQTATSLERSARTIRSLLQVVRKPDEASWS